MFRRHFLQSLFGTVPTALVIGDVTVGGENISPAPVAVAGTATDVVNVKEFGAVGDGTANDTAAIRSAIEAITRSVAALQASAGPIRGSYVGSVRPLYFPAGRYRIDGELVFPPYARILASGGAVLHQDDPDRRVLVFPDGYDVVVEGLKLVGGTHQVDFRNRNTDGATLRLVGCEFQLARGFAVYTMGSLPDDPHLSCNLSAVRCKFIMPRQVLHNVCDSARVEDCWVSVGRTNFAPDTSAFVNLRGDLYLQNMFGVPTVGTGENRLPSVRWIDHHGARITARDCRFGGEDAGMAIVYHYTPDSADYYPFVGAAILLEGGMCYAGPASRADSGVVHLRTGLPQLVIIRAVSGIVGVPYMVNTGSYDIAARLEEIPGVTSKFKYVLGPNLSYPSATVPTELQPFTTLL